MQRLSDYYEQGRALKCGIKTDLLGEAWKLFGNGLSRGFGTLGLRAYARKGVQQLKDKAGLCCLDLLQGPGVMRMGDQKCESAP